MNSIVYCLALLLITFPIAMKAVSEEKAAANLEEREEALDFYPFVEGMTALTIDNSAGEVQVQVLDEAQAQEEGDELPRAGVKVRRDVFDPEYHRIELTGQGDSMTFTCGHREEVKSQRECRVALKVFIPAGVALAIEQGQGSLRVEGFQKPLMVRMGQGKFSGKRLSGPVKVELGQGELELEKLEGDLSVQLGMGKVELDYSGYQAHSKKGPRRVFCNVGQGELKIELPEDARVACSLSLPYGSEIPEGLVPVEEKPDFILEGSLASGSFKLKR